MNLHTAWDGTIANLKDAKKLGNSDEILKRMVDLLNEYKLFIEMDVIFDSENDFLYRQKGQLKLENSIIEEFLPHLICPEILPEISDMEIEVGPTTTFSSIYFTSSLGDFVPGPGLKIRTKAQDFAIFKRLYLKASFFSDFSEEIIESTYIAYVAVECKTNLDKTMFQEATATAHDVKTSVPGAKYYLLCEWLDMTPISTAPTDIDEVIILRKAKRISSNIRKNYSTYEGRRKHRNEHYRYLKENPIHYDMIQRFLTHIKKLISKENLIEEDVIKYGYF